MSSRSRSRSNWQDHLELSLAPSSLFSSKEAVPPPQYITIIDDDGDELEMYVPPSPRETIIFFPDNTPAASRLRQEEDLDLRLGVAASNGSSGSTSGTGMCWKCGEASTSYFRPECNDVKLRCAICMDTMKEETSTLCGHIFCKPCITNTIGVLKRCPTCREELSSGSIHRIYLPEAAAKL